MFILAATVFLSVCPAGVPSRLTLPESIRVWTFTSFSNRAVIFVMDGPLALKKQLHAPELRATASGLYVLRYSTPVGTEMTVRQNPDRGHAHSYTLSCNKTPNPSTMVGLRYGPTLPADDPKWQAAEAYFSSGDPRAIVAYQTLRTDRALRSAAELRLADLEAIAGTLRMARDSYSSLAKRASSSIGNLAAASSEELSLRLGQRFAVSGSSTVNRALEEARPAPELQYRLARVLLAREEGQKALALLSLHEGSAVPELSDMRRQGLVDAALREALVNAFLSEDDETVVTLHARYAAMLVGHGDEAWLQALVGFSMIELDLSDEALAVLGESNELSPLVSRELTAAQAAIDQGRGPQAMVHLEQLRSFVVDDRRALLSRLVVEARGSKLKPQRSQ